MEATIRGSSEADRARAAAPGPVDWQPLLEAAPDAMLVVDAAGRIAAANAECERIFGAARATLVGQRADAWLAEFRRAGAREAARADGSRVGVDVRARDLPDGRGTIVALREARGAGERERHRAEFLAGMGHDLRAPLNAIIGLSELLHEGRAGALAAPQREFLGDVLTSARSLLRLINDVVDVTQMDAGGVAFRREPVSLAAVIEAARDLVRAPLTRKRVALVVECDPAAARVVADPARLRQVLYYLLANAVKFTPEDGRVTVRARPAGARRFRLEVLDAGPPRPWGNALGLEIARRLVEAQGGEVGAALVDGAHGYFAVLPSLDDSISSADSVT